MNYKKLKLTKADIIQIRDKYQTEVPDRYFDSKNLEIVMNDNSIIEERFK